MKHTKQAKHTPGPWIVETYHGSLFKICKPDFKPGDEVSHRLEADARLIAAAPELLEALERIVSINGSTGGAKAMVAEFKFIAQQAIAKARGEG